VIGISRSRLVVAAIVLLVPLALEPPRASDMADHIDAYVKPLVDAGQFSGCILVTQNGQVTYQRAFGMADRKRHIRNTIDTRFCIASITKSMTQALTIQMLVQKKLALTDSLSKFIPDFPRGDEITVENLFRFRAGLPHRVMDEDLENRRYTAADMVEKAKQVPLLYPPGEKSLYSSATYSVLARVLEIAGGHPFPDLLKSTIYAPAKMTETVDYEETANIPKSARGYLLQEDGMVPAPEKDYSFLVGAGSLFSTAHDLCRYFEAVLDTVYGASVTASLAGNGEIGSNGSTNGYRAFAMFSRPKGYGYVVMANVESGANDLIQRDLPALIEGKEVATPQVPTRARVKVDKATLNDYVGTYEREGSNFAIKVEKGELYAGPYRLVPVGQDRYFAYSSYGDITFLRGENSRVTSLTWNSDVWKSEWARKE
jgi:CubicO group peptidase (beta-lactamase class C family)